MVLNRRGQTVLVGLMLGVFVFMMAMVFIDPLRDVITESRAADQLDCSNSTITDGAKATCLIVDLLLPYFIMAVVALAAGLIGARFLG